MRKNNSKARQRKAVIEFFSVFFIVLGVSLAVGGFAMNAYFKSNLQIAEEQTEIETTTQVDITEYTTEEQTIEVTSSTEQEESRQLNVVVYGLDKDETRTDVIFVVNFDTNTKNIKFLSLPRDTRVQMPKRGNVKLNEVHAYGGVDASIQKIEEILGITIDNYVKVNLSGFRNIVDAIGGVEMDVPQAMNYEDPYQDLYIHLQAGHQTLNGKKAEQLVRFRSYAQADLKRIETQHLFMEALLKKVLNMDNIIRKAPTLAYNILKYVKTDIGIDDILDYIKYIGDIKAENVSMLTLPGSAQTIDGRSYFVYDKTETQNMVSNNFFGE